LKALLQADPKNTFKNVQNTIKIPKTEYLEVAASLIRLEPSAKHPIKKPLRAL
jgi:hypothetical protein